MKKELVVPKLSNDITFHYFSKDSYFVHQINYDYRIKISRNVFFILLKIDGTKNLKEITDELDFCKIGVDNLYELLCVKLSQFGIIKSNKAIKKKGNPSYLKLSFIVFPAKLLNKITPFFNFLFKSKNCLVVLIVSLTLIIFGLYDQLFFIKNTDYFLLYPKLIIFSFISVTFHEIGHAAAAQFFGAKHGGIGGGFYLFSPVYFADVSDIWKLSPYHRIVVNLSGIYFECITCMLFVSLGYLLNDTSLKLMSIIFMFSALINLNPFLRRDGYWVLTDYLGIPNLYKQSNQVFLKGLRFISNRDFSFFVGINLWLFIYSIINYMFLLTFLYYVFFINSISVFNFPYKFYDFIRSLFNDFSLINLKEIIPLMLPLLFYYLLLVYLNKKFLNLVVFKKISQRFLNYFKNLSAVTF